MSPTNLKITIDMSEVRAVIDRITADLAKLHDPAFLASAVRFTTVEEPVAPKLVATSGATVSGTILADLRAKARRGAA